MRREGALALLMLAAACGGSGTGGNRAQAPGNGVAAAPADVRDTAATVTLAAAGPGDCSARWGDQPATPQQVLERSAAAVEQAIERTGGVDNLTDATMPTLAMVAPANLPFACADSFLAGIRRAGVVSVLLSPEGGEAALADFSLSDIAARPPTVVLAIGAGGRLTWNGEAIELAAIPERVARLSGASATAIEAPPGELELRPAHAATFGQVHAVLRAVRSGRLRAALRLPSVTPAARPPEPAAARATPPPPAASVPRNQTGQ